ncbi:MAG: YlxR family protein [Geodermatophilaceae bacterium]|nr:YlxR family protein [Geodermatophilaceae bacterium]
MRGRSPAADEPGIRGTDLALDWAVSDREFPVRTCVGCRQRSSISELLRVVAVSGQVVPDPQRRYAGRGAWMHPRPECLARAERRGVFRRALRVTGDLSTGALHSFVADRPG